MLTPLSDLDELVLLCRDNRARAYISEAVVCYRSGAFRAAIVSTWIAVVFDFIHKLQELELTGDLNAKGKLEEFEKSRIKGNYKQALDFERQVLVWAKDEFEFISPIQYDELSRLFDDRNRCAHPSMNSAEEVYQPPAELARLHIRNAVTYLLQYPPVQGKAAIERLKREVESEFFPKQEEEAIKVFRSGPLARPRDSLVRNFLILLLKDIFSIELTLLSNYTAAIQAVVAIHKDIAEAVLREKFSDIIASVQDSELYRFALLLLEMPYVWSLLKPNIAIRLQNYLATVNLHSAPESEKELTVLKEVLKTACCVKTDQLLGVLHRRLKASDYDLMARLVAEYPNPAFVDRSFELYGESDTFEMARKRGLTLVIPIVSVMLPEHVRQLLTTVKENSQIYRCYETPEILRKVRNAEIIPIDEFDRLVDDWDIDVLLTSAIVEEKRDMPF